MDNLKDLLIRSLDDEALTQEEQQLLNSALATGENLVREKQELEKMRQILSDYSPRFSQGFSGRTLEKAFADSTESNNLYFLFKRFALSGVAAIIILLVSVYLTDGSFSLNALLGLSDLTTDNLLLALSTF